MAKSKYPKELISLAKKMVDKDWRLNNLYYIKPKKGPKVRLKLNATQRELHKSILLNNATLKGRQQGVSTYYIIRYLDDVLYNENVTAAIIADKKENIEKLFRIVRFAYKYIPDGLKPVPEKGGGSKYAMYFPEMESRIYVSLEVTSEAVQKLHVSEYALMKNRDRYDASLEAVPEGSGEISIESTPRGLNHFYKDWIDTDWDFKRHFFPWYFHHENSLAVYKNEKITPTEEEKDFIKKAKKLKDIDITKGQLKWRRAKIRKSREKFFQEHPEDDQTCFMMSGDHVLDVESIKKQLMNVLPPKKIDGPIQIYEEYSKTETYICAADTAGGTGGDYYVADIYRVSDWTQCAQIRNNRWRPSEFASWVKRMCKRFSKGPDWPLLGVERNNHGHAVLMALEEIEQYPNLFYHKKYDEKLGWNTTVLTRGPLLDHFVEAVETHILKIKSKYTLAECLTLIDNNGKIEAADGEHDDTIISSAIAVQLLQEARGLDIWNNLGKSIIVG